MACFSARCIIPFCHPKDTSLDWKRPWDLDRLQFFCGPWQCSGKCAEYLWTVAQYKANSEYSAAVIRLNMCPPHTQILNLIMTLRFCVTVASWNNTVHVLSEGQWSRLWPFQQVRFPLLLRWSRQSWWVIYVGYFSQLPLKPVSTTGQTSVVCTSV